jgi:hypothetical protein
MLKSAISIPYGNQHAKDLSLAASNVFDPWLRHKTEQQGVRTCRGAGPVVWQFEIAGGNPRL